LEETLESKTSVAERMKHFFISFLPCRREVETILADFQLSLGAIKSALEIYLRLQHWEKAIACYNVLQMRNKVRLYFIKGLQGAKS